MPESLLQRLKQTARLPTPPGTALQILQLCEKDDVLLSDLADTLAADPAISVRLLKYANSSTLGVRRQITSVRDAVLLLGVRSVRLMALSFSLVSSQDDRNCAGFDYGLFWRYSITCAVGARHLARQVRYHSPEEMFVGGLLSQIGKLILAVGMPEEYAEILEGSGGTLGSTAAAEEARFGSSYHELGADLLVEWGIPDRVTEIIRQSGCETPLRPELAPLIAIVRRATRIADVIHGVVAPTDSQTPEAAGSISPDPAPATLQAIKEEAEKLAVMLLAPTPGAEDLNRLQVRAGEVLGELSINKRFKPAHAAEPEAVPEGACTDPLTCLPNRTAFERSLWNEWSDAVRDQRPIGLLLMELDHLAAFIETHGQEAGDEVIKAAARTISTVVRNLDVTGCYGGGEFAVVLPRIDRLIAAQLCVKLRKCVEQAGILVNGSNRYVTVSIGAAILARPGEPFTPRTLLDEARSQLAVARGRGGNCCSLRQIQPVAVSYVTRSR